MAADPLDIIAGICHEQPHDALTQIAEALGFTEQREQERTRREQTLAGLLKRCARCLPPGHATRVLATGYLRQHGYLSPLRAAGVMASDEARLCPACNVWVKPSTPCLPEYQRAGCINAGVGEVDRA